LIKEAIRCNQEAIRGPLTESAEKPAVVSAVAACARSAKWKKGRGAPGSALLASPWALLRRRASSGRAQGELRASSWRAHGELRASSGRAQDELRASSGHSVAPIRRPQRHSVALSGTRWQSPDGSEQHLKGSVPALGRLPYGVRDLAAGLEHAERLRECLGWLRQV
jgi:hypothetical protein